MEDLYDEFMGDFEPQPFYPPTPFAETSFFQSPLRKDDGFDPFRLEWGDPLQSSPSTSVNPFAPSSRASPSPSPPPASSSSMGSSPVSSGSPYSSSESSSMDLPSFYSISNGKQSRKTSQKSKYVPVKEESPSDGADENTRKRKRRKYIRQEDVKPTPVTLPRQTLLTITLEQMDEYIKEKRSTRRLTEEEDQDLKRQRRLVKNRVSALASRNRKKEETELMEDQVARLRKENMLQREQIARLESENESLKKEMVHLNQLLLGNGYLNSDVLSEMMSSISSVEIGQPSSSKVAGIAVMVLLFSFGALLGPFSFQDPILSQNSPPALLPQASNLQPEPLRRKQRDILQVAEPSALEGSSSSSSSVPLSRAPPPAPMPVVTEFQPEPISIPPPLIEESSQKNNSDTQQENVLIQMVVPRSIFSTPSRPSEVPAFVSASVTPASSSTISLSSTSNVVLPASSNGNSTIPLSSSTRVACTTTGWSAGLPPNFVEVSCHLFQVGGNQLSKLKA